MGFVISLWLPILMSSALLFFASFVAWMVLPHHRSDRRRLDCEDELLKVIRELGVQPGNYLFPYAATKQDHASPEFADKTKRGPIGTLDVWSSPNMGANLACTYLFFLATATLIGYITYVACPPSDEASDFSKVFRVAGSIGVLTYGSSGILNGIWFKRRLMTDIMDGIAYGLLLGLVFGWLWP